MKGRIYIISGFSGAGKSTLCEKALENLEDVELIKSYTTRLPRGEKDDGYHFISKDTFEKMEHAGEFLETNFYNENYYGTPLGDVNRCLETGKNAVLEIDVHGYQKILDCGLFDRNNIHSIFVVAKASELFKRLWNRNTENAGKIMDRMLVAVEESKMLDLYDVLLENNDYLESVKTLKDFLMGENVTTDKFDKDYFAKEAEILVDTYKRVMYCKIQQNKPITLDHLMYDKYFADKTNSSDT